MVTCSEASSTAPLALTGDLIDGVVTVMRDLHMASYVSASSGLTSSSGMSTSALAWPRK